MPQTRLMTYEKCTERSIMTQNSDDTRLFNQYFGVLFVNRLANENKVAKKIEYFPLI